MIFGRETEYLSYGWPFLMSQRIENTSQKKAFCQVSTSTVCLIPILTFLSIMFADLCPKSFKNGSEQRKFGAPQQDHQYRQDRRPRRIRPNHPLSG